MFAGFIPGLLMLSTVGLQRLESIMRTDRPVARNGHSTGENVVPLTGFSGLSPRMEPAYRLIPDEPGLPTRRYGAVDSDPQFQPSRFANPV